VKTGKTGAITTQARMKQIEKKSENQPLLINPILPSVKALSHLITAYDRSFFQNDKWLLAIYQQPV
jgi:hypothetical protein